MSNTSGPPGLAASIISRRPLPPSYTAIAQIPGHNSAPEPNAAIQPAKPDEVGAKWRIGWKTPTLIVIYYVLALLVSITHLSMLIFLDNKPVSSYRQSYVTTASTILASVFGLCLQAALGIAFTQRLWNILRQSAHKLELIENLFTMRSTPYLALRWAVIQSAPLLSVFTIILWSLQIATNFPPGALTVDTKPHETTVLTQVMALNTSYLRDTPNIIDALDDSIAPLWVVGNHSNSSIELSPERSESVLRLASHTMISGAVTTSPSPCGSNCSYHLQFVGPYLLCDPPTKSFGGLVYPNGSYPLYIGVWSNPSDDMTIPYEDGLSIGRRTEPISIASFNITLLTPLGVELESGKTFTEMSFQRCRPGQTTYNVNVTYQDGAQKFVIQTDPGSTRLLTDLTKPTSFDSSKQWPEASLQWLSDANNMAIIEPMAMALAGEYVVQVIHYIGAGDFNYTLNNGSNITLASLVTIDDSYKSYKLNGMQSSYTGPENGTIIASTAINLRLYDSNTSEGPELVMGQDILNEMLQNITLSLMNTIGIWNTEVNATQSTLINVYSFSNKLNLLLPYYISLVVALSLLVLGSLSLYQNGVSATDGGFLQILTTTSTSKALHEAASGGVLGGDENVPKELKELKVRYGELVNNEEESKAGTRRAGFGVEDEVIPIQKGVRYSGGGCREE